jgi:hypothetical protein
MVVVVYLLQNYYQADHCKWTRDIDDEAATDWQQRLLSYASRRDKFSLGASLVASVLAGGTLPLMNVIFGNT